MNPRAVLWIACVCALGFADAPPRDASVRDGFAATQRMALDLTAALETYEGSFIQDVNDALDEGQPLSPEAGEVMDAIRPWWDRLDAIATAPEWNHPPREELGPESEWPDTTGVLTLFQAIKLEASVRLREGKVVEAMDLLLAADRLGQRYATSGILIHALVGIAGQKLFMDVKVRALHAYPDEKRAALHRRLLALYETVPTSRALLKGERHLLRNGIDLVFRDEKLQRIPPELKRELVARLRKQGVQEETLRAIEEERILSPRQWRKSMEKEVDRVLGLLFHVEDLSLHDISKRYDRLHARVEMKENDGRFAPRGPVVAFQKALENEESDLALLQAAHRDVGQALTRQYLRLIIPISPGVHGHLRQYRAEERLVVIESAQRIFLARHGRPPERVEELIEADLLTGEMAVDPLNGERFRRLPGKPFRLYSVGMDGKDGGGETRDRRKGDFWLEPPNER